MLGRLNHVALAVPDLAAAADLYRTRLGASVSAPLALPEHGVSIAFVDLPNTRIELMEPLGADSPIMDFLRRHPDGGMHHLCYEVKDLGEALERLREDGTRILGDARIGAHGNPVAFIHPKAFSGTLIELEEVRTSE